VADDGRDSAGVSADFAGEATAGCTGQDALGDIGSGNGRAGAAAEDAGNVACARVAAPGGPQVNGFPRE
jgi:hypothetical protein